MPLAQRLARLLPPKQTSLQFPLAGYISRSSAVTPVRINKICNSRQNTESRRTWASATSPRQDQSKPSIFAELFPDQARNTQEKTTAEDEDDYIEDTSSLKPDGATVPEEVRQWLESEGEAAGDAGEDAEAASSSRSKTKKRRTEPTVLVLSGTTPSLLPSDFFRIAPRVMASSTDQDGGSSNSSSSRLVDGWAAGNGGIYKIVQDRDPATLAPRGRYFLYFGSSAAALAYSQEVRELHMLARRAVQQPQKGAASAKRRHKRKKEDQEETRRGNSGDDYSSLAGNISSGGSGIGSDAYLATSATAAEVAALRSFSLLAPTAQLDLVMQMPAGSSVGPSSTSGITLYDEEELDDVAAVTATTKVLVVLEDTSSSGGGGGVSKKKNDGKGPESFNAGGGGITTVEGLRTLIEEDGVRRNLPWAVSDGLNGVVPVQWLVAEQKRLLHEAVRATNARAAKHKKKAEAESTQNTGPSHPPVALWASRVPDLVAKTNQMNENARFSRFVVAFSDAVEARRFVRNWHRRAVSVPVHKAEATYEHTAIVDTTVLW